MLISDIKRVIDQISRDKGIGQDVLKKTIEEALKSAAKKTFGNRTEIEVQYNQDAGEIEVYQFKDVVTDVQDPEREISLEDGRVLDPDCEIGDSLGIRLDTATFGRIAAQSAKQVIIQKMKDAERSSVYANFIDRKGETLNGIVQRIDRGDIIVNLGHTEAVLPVREQVPRENYRRGDRVRAIIINVKQESKGPQIVLSRTHIDFLVNLFKMEVPEINEGIVKIMTAAREPGSRSKIAVGSSDPDIDPVGACVGMKGSRVQNVVTELRGEKIDIIPWHIDPAKFVCNALSPAEISRVIIDEDNRAMEVIVPDESLSVAIGKKGQNVRLASKLTGWHLDVVSESEYSKTMKDGYDSLMQVPGVNIGIADALYEKGFFSAEELSMAAVEDLVQIRDIDEAKARELIENASRIIESRNEEGPDDAEAKIGDNAVEEGSQDHSTGDDGVDETDPSDAEEEKQENPDAEEDVEPKDLKESDAGGVFDKQQTMNDDNALEK